MTRTFMGPQPGGRMKPRHDHQAEKSDEFYPLYVIRAEAAAQGGSTGGHEAKLPEYP
jgi:hypothetical protein